MYVLLLRKCRTLLQVCARTETRVYFTGQDECPCWPRISFALYAVDLVV